jgi:H+/Cl- antiporter ClcA
VTAAEIEGRSYLRLVGLGALIGVPAALLAALFIALVHELEDLLWPDSPAWYLVIGLPIAGAAICALARALLPGDGGHSPLQGIGGGATPLAYAPGIALAAIATLAFGAVLGPEAPLIALGSVTGVALARIVRLGEREEKVLASAGSFAAISALFDGPLVAGMLLVEGGLAMGTSLLGALLPGLVAAALGYVLFIGLGDWGGLDAASLAVPGLPSYVGTHVLDLVLAVVVGAAAAAAIFAIRRLATRIEGAELPMTALLLAGGAATGLLAAIADALGADPKDVLFSGQTALPHVVAESSAGIVLVLFAAKGLGYAVCLGCGFRGGPVFPAVFLGVAVAMLPVIAFDVSPTWAVAVGTAGGMAAGTRLLFAPILLGAARRAHRAGRDSRRRARVGGGVADHQRVGRAVESSRAVSVCTPRSPALRCNAPCRRPAGRMRSRSRAV